jgi:hypothetical protein
MGTFPCAGCGRSVVVTAVLCVDCELRLRAYPTAPRNRHAAGAAYDWRSGARTMLDYAPSDLPTLVSDLGA